MASTRMTTYRLDAFVRAIMQDVPQESPEARYARACERLVKHMSPHCQAVYEEDPDVLRKFDGWAHEFGEMSDDLPAGNLTNEEVAKLMADFVAEYELRRNIEVKVRNTLRGYHSVEAALKALPEFEKYLSPAAVSPPTQNLPALANVMSDLAKLGWPKKK